MSKIVRYYRNTQILLPVTLMYLMLLFIIPMVTQWHRPVTKKMISPEQMVESPVSYEGVALGKIVIGYNLDRLNKMLEHSQKNVSKDLGEIRATNNTSLRQAAINMAVLYLIIGVVVSLLMFVLFRKMVVSQLATLERSFHDIAEGKGDLRQRVYINGNDAIDRLGNNFNTFLDKIHHTMNEV
ncbi:MAG TPA: methyl-accepting chemotaxis protein, partial [Gammaproteobacteria bacterium]|nr:methyl-accepting chemotaxis protein [Gammaproteobacteria bacterium]